MLCTQVCFAYLIMAVGGLGIWIARFFCLNMNTSIVCTEYTKDKQNLPSRQRTDGEQSEPNLCRSTAFLASFLRHGSISQSGQALIFTARNTVTHYLRRESREKEKKRTHNISDSKYLLYISPIPSETFLCRAVPYRISIVCCARRLLGFCVGVYCYALQTMNDIHACPRISSITGWNAKGMVAFFFFFSQPERGLFGI